MDHFLTIATVAVFIENRLQSGFEYAELEKATGFSLPHIRALYAKHTGKSLSRYVLSRRIAHAAFEIIHTEQSILSIAAKYGFSNPDSFTRAFRRITGVNPNVFRKQRMPVGRARLSMGVIGISVEPENSYQKNAERIIFMKNSDQKHVSDGSVVLYGVPKVSYGAGGVTPLPIAMKAAANYMGIELDYTEAIVYCGMAFRLTWNETCWDGGNVDGIWTFDDPSKVFRCAIESLGCQYNMIGRTPTTSKSDFVDFIKDKIDAGIPVIARGIVGPPEAGIITGYRDNGYTLLGWSLFQEFQEFAGNISFDESGYYISDQWWENQDTRSVMSFGQPTGGRFTIKNVVENAIEVMTPRKTGSYAKAGLAYDAWKKALLDESQFKKDMVNSLMIERLMCHGDAMDCLADGRNGAYKYFKRLADENPSQPLYGRIAEQFAQTATQADKMYHILGGYDRGEKQMQLLAKREIREQIAGLIDKCKAADEKALELLKELLVAL